MGLKPICLFNLTHEHREFVGITRSSCPKIGILCVVLGDPIIDNRYKSGIIQLEDVGIARIPVCKCSQIQSLKGFTQLNTGSLRT